MIPSVPPVLERAREAVVAPLTEAIERLAPQLRRVVTYQLGWTEVDGTPTGGTGGKALRPALALLSAEAVGAAPEVALAGAAALELVHNFSLLHDDVMDGDRERRHRPSAWAAYGVGEAIVAGDALVVLAIELLEQNGDRRKRLAGARLRAATAEMIAGQVEDLALETQPLESSQVTMERCLAMSEAKTAAILSCSASIGAELAGAPEATVEALACFGRHLGIAFQATDDLLGIWGESERTGKPVGSDLRQHKKTLPVVAALEGAGPRRAELVASLTTDPMTQEDVERAARLVDQCGGRQAAFDLAGEELALAGHSLSSADLVPGPAGELAELARFVTAREW
ncbi:MAG: polyprenyl synthetase family protein [Acidimicrobiales bacterium]|nr:polyprenyl synthetase family protein [Acidimicrobiales bacterium]MBO0893850.1 polyprenyl synthetase family protein [Acidimicrobiales bacterium]